MGRVARNSDIRKLEFLKGIIDDSSYQERAMDGIAELLTHILFDDNETKQTKNKRRSKQKPAKVIDKP